VKCKTRSCTHR